MKTLDMELAVADYFNPRRNIIVPNVSWGFRGMHECDLFILSKSGYATEVEIKVSKSDLVKDKLKPHGHKSKYIKTLYFALPEKLAHLSEHMPERAGILSVSDNKNWRGFHRVTVVRPPKVTKTPYKFSMVERLDILRLSSLRVWSLKKKLNKKVEI